MVSERNGFPDGSSLEVLLPLEYSETSFKGHGVANFFDFCMNNKFFGPHTCRVVSIRNLPHRQHNFSKTEMASPKVFTV